MIKNLNILIINFIKIQLFLKTNLKNMSFQKKIYIRSFQKKLIKLNFFFSNYRNKPINIMNDYFYLIFFNYFFYIIFLTLKNKIFFFNNVSINYMFKHKYIFYKSFNNFFFKNELNFYKNYNKIYKNFKLTSKNKSFFILKKKKEFINPTFFINFNNYLKKIRLFKNKNWIINILLNFNFNCVFFNNFNYSKKFKVQIKKNLNFLNTTDLSLFNFGSLIQKYSNIKPLKNIKFNYLNEKKLRIKNLFIDINLLFLNLFLKKNFNFNNVTILKNFKQHFQFNSKKNLVFFRTTYYFVSFFFLKIHQLYKLKFKTKKYLNKNLISNFISKSKLACFNLIYLNDFFQSNFIVKNCFFLSNNFFLKSFRIIGNFFQINSNFNDNYYFYNNYYPIVNFKQSKNRFLSKIKSNTNFNYISYFNLYIIGFLEKFFKKRFFIKSTNNKFNKPGYFLYLLSIYNNYKNYQPKYMKSFLISDFLEIFWYSLYLKDLSMISEWLCKFLEKTHFRFHRKFILFFQNFFHKNYSIFFNILKIKGFFFDIRGKVGVAGNSKKRHFFFKSGVIGKSTKKMKMDFKQSVVRTPSGALGLTLIVSY